MKISQERIATLAVAVLVAGLLGSGIGYLLHSEKPVATIAVVAPSANRTPIYYQNPDGKADYSPTRKKTSDGRDYVPVYDETAAASAPVEHKRILYYRNPMGLADTSLVPKKDAMGMEYVPVYEDESELGVVSVSPQRVQMLGVRTAPVKERSTLSLTIRATGTIQADESKLSVVTTKFDGFVEKLFVTTTGVSVRKGEPLARVWIQTPDVVTQMGPDVITRQIDYIIALQEKNEASIAQALVNLRNYGIPDSAIAEIRRTGRATRSIIITAPRSGVILEKSAVEGMRFAAGDPLFKVGDLSTVWLMTDVAEQDLGSLHLGAAAHATLVAYPGRTYDGTVDFIYPSLAAATRTGRARIALPNSEGLLRESMYASVSIEAAAAPAAQMLVVPDSAVIDSGARQVVLVALGQGRFAPRAVQVGAHGDGYSEITDGLRTGEQVVVGANFLIDAESSLRAALQAFAPAAKTEAP